MHSTVLNNKAKHLSAEDMGGLEQKINYQNNPELW